MIRVASILGGERFEQCAALLRSKTPNSSSLTDPDLFDDAAGLDLADSWQGFQHCQDLDLAGNVVVLGLVEEFLQGHRTHFEALFQLRTSATSERRLLECRGTLLGCEFRGQWHVTSICICTPTCSNNLNGLRVSTCG